jgi:hypothetical protein
MWGCSAAAVAGGLAVVAAGAAGRGVQRTGHDRGVKSGSRVVRAIVRCCVPCDRRTLSGANAHRRPPETYRRLRGPRPGRSRQVRVPARPSALAEKRMFAWRARRDADRRAPRIKIMRKRHDHHLKRLAASSVRRRTTALHTRRREADLRRLTIWTGRRTAVCPARPSSCAVPSAFPI